MPSILAYWNVQALGHPIRFLLNYVEEDFEDKHYIRGPPPEFSRDDWLKDKYNLGLDFPNLPYYIDNEVKITQSNNIMRYIGRKYNIGGSTVQEKNRVDLALDQIYDNRLAMGMALFSADFDKAKEDFEKTVPDKFKLYDEFLGDCPYIAGKNVTVADFPMYAMLKEHKLLLPDCLNDFPKLQAFIERIENLPQIKKYITSESYPKLPLNGKMAKFGTDFGY